jgi:hypothetical protein
MMIAWIACTVVVAVIAASRKRSPVGWALLSLVISPLLATIAVALLPPVPRRQAPPTVDRRTARRPDQAAVGRKVGGYRGWTFRAAVLAIAIGGSIYAVHLDRQPAWHDTSPRLAPVGDDSSPRPAPMRVLIEIPAPDPAAAGRMLDDRALASSRLTPLN